MVRKTDFVVWFSDVDKDDVAFVGGKGANLGEMVQSGFSVPNGFIVTTNAYYSFLRENNLASKIKHLIGTANFDKPESLTQVSNHIKKLILTGKMQNEEVLEIFKFYRKLGGLLSDALVAVRSSATAEDLPNASFAGQQETFLNVRGEANLILKIKEAWASLFNARALFYRHQQRLDHLKVGIAVPVQKMVVSEKSGVMFTIDPVTNDKSKITIEAIFGLGEMIVQGKVIPDHYEVQKSDLTLLQKSVSYQNIMLKKVGRENKEIKLSKREGGKQKISEKEIIDLAKIGKKLEHHYYFPQDVEWAIEKNKIYVVQTRPVTTLGNRRSKIEDRSKMENGKWKMEKLLLKGDSASPGIASGPVRIVHSLKDLGKILPGEVLVAQQTNPDFVSAMRKAVAVVTDKGGRTSHAAIVSRELGIPAVVGTEKATKILKTGNVVTVNGEKGEIYKGGHLSPTLPLSPITHLKTATKVYVNLAEPHLAEKTSHLNADGVGLLRAEFIMADLGIHPKKAIRDGKKNFYIKKLEDGIESFCKAFNPRPVIYRASDLKTNEYRDLAGGKEFEPMESNPMLGYRGAYRYINDPEVFKLELEAIGNLRIKKGYKNLWLMIPYVRTVKELIAVKKLVSNSGLFRSSTFKLWMMVEIPSNVILLEKFIWAGIDGVSMGSNDLTMLLLGTDRDNDEIASEFNEQDEAVLWAIEHVIKTAHKHNITSSICGQAPSQYPALVEKLVKWGVTSVSVSPDAIDNVRKTISECEKRLIK